MSFFKRWIENYEHATRNKVLVELKGLPERHLALAGISPELLEKGVDAWPWHAAETREKEARPEVVKNLFGEPRKTAVAKAGIARTAESTRELDSAA